LLFEKEQDLHTGTIFGPLAGRSSSIIFVCFVVPMKNYLKKNESNMTKEEAIYCIKAFSFRTIEYSR
jgi:hypothetical protein